MARLQTYYREKVGPELMKSLGVTNPMRVPKITRITVNMVKRHTRPNPQRGTQGGVVEKEASLHLSNVLLWNQIAKQGDRVGFRTLADGRRVRYFKSNDEVVDA